MKRIELSKLNFNLRKPRPVNVVDRTIGVEDTKWLLFDLNLSNVIRVCCNNLCAYY